MKIEVRKCEFCDKYFKINIDNKKSNSQRFCSKSCSSKIKNLGKHHTDEWKREMSINSSGKNNPFFGKKHTHNSISKMSVSSQWKEDKYKFCNMSEKEKEIFDGIMISDGSLSSSRISARLTLGFKYLETIERIIYDLSSLRFSIPYPYKTEFGLNFFSKSGFYRDLLLEYNRWYNNGIKIIPNDIKITPLFFYWWYVCDGYISNDNIYFCTDSFTKSDIEKISDKINLLGFKNKITSRNRIRFFKKDSIHFLEYISYINIQDEYLYKFILKNK